MGCPEEQTESSYTPRLPLLPMSHAQYTESPERPGALTPPLHASASVPFRWEEQPGKPKPCTDLIPFSDPNDFVPKCLELPPRLLADAKLTKLPSPTTVLDGPYIGRSRFQSTSFRMGGECYGSFRSGSCSPEMVPLGAVVLSRRVQKERGFLASWRKRGFTAKKEAGGSSYVFPSSMDRESDCSRDHEESSSGSVKITRIRRVGSFSSLSHAKPHFWVSIYEGLKQVVPWRSKRTKKEGMMNL